MAKSSKIQVIIFTVAIVTLAASLAGWIVLVAIVIHFLVKYW
jgi:hypothetical protein